MQIKCVCRESERDGVADSKGEWKKWFEIIMYSIKDFWAYKFFGRQIFSSFFLRIAHNTSWVPSFVLFHTRTHTDHNLIFYESFFCFKHKKKTRTKTMLNRFTRCVSFAFNHIFTRLQVSYARFFARFFFPLRFDICLRWMQRKRNLNTDRCVFKWK